MSTEPTSLPYRCPHDNSLLSVHENSTALICPTCNLNIPIVDGIPRFIQDEHLASFGLQWNKYEVAHEEEDRQTFTAKTGLELSSLSGKRVLDAGCGGGRYAKLVAEAGAELVAADHTQAVDKAAGLCQQHLGEQAKTIQFIQADLKSLPFPPESFDVVFSIGVMHHDENTRDVFDAIARKVKPGGTYSVWLYRKNQWWQEAVNNWLRKRTLNMPTERLEKWCRVGAFLGGLPLVNKLLNKVVNFSSHPNWENRVCDTFDWYAPQYQHHHTIDELQNWFEEAGFTNLKILPPEKKGILYNFVYEHNLLIGSGVNIQGTRK